MVWLSTCSDFLICYLYILDKQRSFLVPYKKRMWKADAPLCHGFVPTFRGIPCYPDVSRNSNELASWKREGPRDVAGHRGSSGFGNLEICMKSSLNQSPSKRLGTSGRLGSPTLLPDLFVSDHTDAIGCSRLLQSDTGSREKGKMCQPWRNKAKGAGHCCFCCSCSMSTCFSWLVPPLFSPSHKSLIFAIKSTLLNWWQLIATHQRPCQVKQSSS